MTGERASEHDREYFRRLGRWKAELRADDLKAHLALPPKERQRRSEELARRSRGWAKTPRVDNVPDSFFERAKRLGLYRS